jgi:hypothetical protein
LEEKKRKISKHINQIENMIGRVNRIMTTTKRFTVNIDIVQGLGMCRNVLEASAQVIRIISAMQVPDESGGKELRILCNDVEILNESTLAKLDEYVMDIDETEEQPSQS